MPKQVEMRVIVGGHRKENLRVGDMITAQYSGEVVKIEEKVKWAFTTVRTKPYTKVGDTATGRQQQVHVTAGNHRFKLPIGSEVNITREMPTDEEELAEKIDRFYERMVRNIKEAKVAPAKAFQAMSARFQEGRKQGWLNAFDLDQAMTVAARQEAAKFWLNIEAQWMDLMDKGNDPKESMLMAVAAQRERTTQWLLSPYHHEVLSRSTSATSNLREDLERKAAAEFLDGFRFDDQPEDMLDRLTGVKS